MITKVYKKLRYYYFMSKVNDINILSKFTTDFCNIVKKHCKYVVISGFTAIATGRTRGTEDIDIIIPKLDKNSFLKLHNDLLDKFEVLETDCFEEVFERLDKDKSNIRYVYKSKLLPNIELKFVKDLVDEAAIQNRIKIPLTKLDIWFGPIESNIAFKETILTSEKDKEDAKHLRETFENEISEVNIKYFKDLIIKYRK